MIPQRVFTSRRDRVLAVVAVTMLGFASFWAIRRGVSWARLEAIGERGPA